MEKVIKETTKLMINGKLPKEEGDKILLALHNVSISLVRAKKYARHQHFLGTQGKELVEFEDWKQD
jgi:hypothetical protein